MPSVIVSLHSPGDEILLPINALRSVGGIRSGSIFIAHLSVNLAWTFGGAALRPPLPFPFPPPATCRANRYLAYTLRIEVSCSVWSREVAILTLPPSLLLGTVLKKKKPSYILAYGLGFDVLGAHTDWSAHHTFSLFLTFAGSLTFLSQKPEPAVSSALKAGRDGLA